MNIHEKALIERLAEIRRARERIKSEIGTFGLNSVALRCVEEINRKIIEINELLDACEIILLRQMLPQKIQKMIQQEMKEKQFPS